MRILVINPNSSEAVTAAIDDTIRPLRIAGGPEIAVDRLKEGPVSIASQLDADSVVLPLASVVARDRADAFVIACFSDPGLHAAREAAARRPVFGIGECAILHALIHGERFGIIALSSASIRRQQKMVRQMGVDARYAGSLAIDASASDTTRTDILPRLAKAGRALVTTHGADVVILGCAGMAGHRAALESAIGSPVVEPVQQAVACALGALLLRHA